MIASAPISAAASFDGIASKVSAFLRSARDAAADGITWQEFGTLLVALLRVACETLDTVDTLPGPEKKAIALEAVASLFDQVADRCVPWTLSPVWMLLRPTIRSLVLALAAGAIEQILPMIRSR
jgi:hypothetical protein